MTGPAKGEQAPLLHTKQSQERVIVGLQWDPRDDAVGALDAVIRHDSQHDMDILCFVYDENGDFIDYVGAEAQDSMDSTGCIYHSGDDMSGEGNGDDETLSIELGPLPAEIQSLVILVEVKSLHVFGDIVAPWVHLFDSLTGADLASTGIAENSGENDKRAFIFAALHRDPVSKSGWTLHHIGDYPDISNISDWGSYLMRYLG